MGQRADDGAIVTGRAEPYSDIRFDLILAGGEVVDGLGTPRFVADVGIVGDTIAAVGDLSTAVGKERLDASDLVVCPGFVDIHGHSDLAILSAPEAPSKILQGVTTEVMGNCGMAVAPLAADVEQATFRTALATGDVDSGVIWDWRSVAEYRERVARSGTAMSVELLAGHLPIRVSCMGYDDRTATPAELAAMQRMVDAALDEGACGLSTGLSLPPMSYADLDELVALGEVVAGRDSIFTFHMRDYKDDLLDAVAEALAVARKVGCRVQISHLAVRGRSNWGKVADALSMIDAAADEGCDVGLDIYPYLAGSGNLTQALPDWASEGGAARLLERLRQPEVRERIVADVTTTPLLDSWDELVLAGGNVPNGRALVGQSIARIADDWAVRPAEVVVGLIEQSKVTASVVAFGRSEQDLEAALQHPLTMIGSDGLALDPDGPSGKGQPHPRSYGCYPRLLGRYVRDTGLLSLEQAVHKSTRLPAERFGFADRGMVAPGLMADLVVFDPGAIGDLATYERPHRLSLGIHAVVVGGRIVGADGATTGVRSGRVLAGRSAGPSLSASSSECRAR